MTKMAMMFVGHGSPMNAVEDNRDTRGWIEMAKRIPRPEAIVSVSAHWFTNGTRIMKEEKPRTVYDMYGFPEELYEIVYDAPGNPKLAARVMEMIGRESVFDPTWGIDHGTWSVLVHMYPGRDIPLFQISIDSVAPPQAHYQIGRELKSLREEGVLLFATGNIVHNLRLIDWGLEDKGFDWAYEFDDFIMENIRKKNHGMILDYNQNHMGKAARLAVPVADHFYPLLYVLGASDEKDTVEVYNHRCIMGSLSMTSYLFG